MKWARCVLNFHLLFSYVLPLVWKVTTSEFQAHMQYLSCLLLGSCTFYDFLQIKQLVSPLPSCPKKDTMYSLHTGLRNLEIFSRSRLDFPRPLSSILLLCRCFLSESCRHPGGHTWSALHLEHLQAVIARESPLHTWYAGYPPHRERGKKNVTCVHAHKLFMDLKSRQTRCSLCDMSKFRESETILLGFVCTLIFCPQDQANW